jgi:hypothetical protein
MKHLKQTMSEQEDFLESLKQFILNIESDHKKHWPNSIHEFNITNLNTTKRDIHEIKYIVSLIDRMMATTKSIENNVSNLNALVELKNKFIKSISFKVDFTISEQDFVSYLYNYYYKQLAN